MVVIAIVNQKGGVGKTTTVIEIAHILSEDGYRVLAIDFDSQANFTTYLGEDKTSDNNIFRVLNADIPVEDAIKHVDGYDFICGSKALSKSDKTFIEYDDVFLLSDVLESVRDKYDFVLIDNGPSRSTLLTMSYVASDYIVVPCSCDDGGTDGVEEVYNDLQEMRSARHTISHARILGIILTAYEKTNMHADAWDRIEQLQNNIEEKPFIDKVRKAITVSEAKTARESLQQYDKYSNPAMDYRRIVKEIIERTK